MKSKKIIVCLLVCICLFTLWGCTGSTNMEKKYSLTYSNLVDEDTQHLVKTSLLHAGIKEKKIDSFLLDVSLFNMTVGDVGLVPSGFHTIESLKPIYDNAKMFPILDQEYPGVLWHNCRLTTFRLMNDFITMSNPKIEDTVMLFQDQESIGFDETLVDEKQNHFLSLYSYIDTKNTQDVKEHVKVLQNNWKEKGLQFKNGKVHVISVVFHVENVDNSGSQLFIGHQGMLWELTDEDLKETKFQDYKGKFLFLEKLSFMEPYQLVVFNNRVELNDYLMNTYDVDLGQEIAIPFIMEDEHLLEGYRPNMDKGE